jgi:hypothetical protein
MISESASLGTQQDTNAKPFDLAVSSDSEIRRCLCQNIGRICRGNIDPLSKDCLGGASTHSLPGGPTMKLSRVDVISMFDFQYQRRWRNKVRSSEACDISSNLNTSYGWMFYGSALPRCARYCFPSLTLSMPAERGACVLLYPDLSVGVCSIWQQFVGDADPLAVKNKAWQWYFGYRCIQRGAGKYWNICS